MLKLKSLDVWRKAIVPIIIILDHLEVNIEISDNGMKTVGFNEYKKSSRVNEFTNGMLATI